MSALKRHWQLALLTIVNGVLPLALAAVSVFAIGCDIPLIPPLPEPPVIVDPDVKPINGVAWSIVLYESADMTGNLSLLKADPYWDPSKSRWYDVDSKDAASSVAVTQGIKRPTLLLIDATGKKLWAGELPMDIEQIKKRIGGAK